MILQLVAGVLIVIAVAELFVVHHFYKFFKYLQELEKQGCKVTFEE